MTECNTIKCSTYASLTDKETKKHYCSNCYWINFMGGKTNE